MKALKFNNTEVSLNFTTYRNNGTLAVQMNTVPDKDLYGVITVNLGCPLQNDTAAGIGEHFHKGKGTDDFLDEVDIRVLEIGGELLYPLFSEAFLTYHRPSRMNSCSNCSRQCLRPA